MNKITSLPGPLSPGKIPWEEVENEFQSQCGKSYYQQISDFESRLTDYLDCNSVVALNSGTAGIHLALRTLGVKSWRPGALF